MEELLNEIPSDIDETDEESEWPEFNGFESNSGQNSTKTMENNEAAIDKHSEIPGKIPGSLDDDQDQMPLPDVSCDSCSKLFSVSEIAEHQNKCSKKKKMSDKNIQTCKYCQIELKLPSFSSISGKIHQKKCEKYHSFISTGGDDGAAAGGLVCKFCKTNKVYKIGKLFQHFEKYHARDIYIPKNKPSANNPKQKVRGGKKSRGRKSIFPSSKCLLCDFNNDAESYSAKYQLMEKHYWKQHFEDKINSEVIPKMPKTRPFKCPAPNCDYNRDGKLNIGIGKGKKVLLHYIRKHGILKNYINEAIQKERTKEHQVVSEMQLLHNNTESKKNPKSKKNETTSEAAVVEKKIKGRKSVCLLPSTEKCKLCEFVNKVPTNQHQIMFRHYSKIHFQDRINEEIRPILPNKEPFNCPDRECSFVCKSKNNCGGRFQILEHYLKNHGLINRFIKEAEENASKHIEEDKRQKENVSKHIEEDKKQKENASKRIEEDKTQKENNASKHIKMYCVNCKKPKNNNENFKFCMDCLNQEVLIERREHMCRLCDKIFSTLAETHEHIDSEHCQYYDTFTEDEGKIITLKLGAQSFTSYPSRHKRLFCI